MTEQRLIDANALRERMYHDAFETDTDMQKWDSGCWIRYKMFENAIDDAPTIEERKNGKWIRHYSRPNVYADLCWHCSCCGYKTPDTWANKWNYCPNCGADMRGTGYGV